MFAVPRNPLQSREPLPRSKSKYGTADAPTGSGPWVKTKRWPLPAWPRVGGHLNLVGAKIPDFCSCPSSARLMSGYIYIPIGVLFPWRMP